MNARRFFLDVLSLAAILFSVLAVAPVKADSDFSIDCCFSTGRGDMGRVAAGTTYSSWGWVTSINGFTGDVGLTITLSLNIPVTINPSTVNVPAGGIAEPDVTFQVPSSTTPGTYTGVFTGTSGSITHTEGLTLTVDPPPPDYSVSASPGSLTIIAGSSGMSTVTITSINGFATSNGCPNYWGVMNLNSMVSPNAAKGPTSTVSPNCVSLAGGGKSSASLTVYTTTTTPLGNYTVSVNACFQVSPSGWTTCRSTNISLTVIDPKVGGDVNGDGKVNIIDLVMVGSTFGATRGSPDYNPTADLNNDGVVNIFDLTIVGTHFGT